ncbi:MAG: hypothetical protein PVF58_08665 [Candidatus Methanofastidiosia archaeon]|jgi:hypothetical protein
MSDNSLTLTIGGIAMALIPHSNKEFHLPENCNKFVTHEQPDVFLHMWDSYAPIQSLQEKKKIFETDNMSTYRSSEELIILFCMAGKDDAPQRMIKVNTQRRSIDLYAKSAEHCKYFDPLERFLFRILMVNIFSWGLGVMIHASGINDNGRGMIFVGKSGAGKSTIANLWKEKDSTVLGDDTLIIRKREEHFWVYGVPWKDTHLTSPDPCPLENIFFIEHAKENILKQKKGTLNSILPHILHPLWNVSGVKFSMNFLSELVKKIPCYMLGFVPDKRIIDFIRAMR